MVSLLSILTLSLTRLLLSTARLPSGGVAFGELRHRAGSTAFRTGKLAASKVKKRSTTAHETFFWNRKVLLQAISVNTDGLSVTFGKAKRKSHVQGFLLIVIFSGNGAPLTHRGHAVH